MGVELDPAFDDDEVEADADDEDPGGFVDDEEAEGEEEGGGTGDEAGKPCKTLLSSNIRLNTPHPDPGNPPFFLSPISPFDPLFPPLPPEPVPCSGR